MISVALHKASRDGVFARRGALPYILRSGAPRTRAVVLQKDRKTAMPLQLRLFVIGVRGLKE